MKLFYIVLTISIIGTNVNADNKLDPSKIHAVLVSAIECVDSSCSISYAVEAEIAHAYHLLRANGIPANQIIVFHLDDATNSTDYNPKPGTLCTDKDLTTNYREGLQIDYTGEDVNVENVLAVLQGDKEGVKGGNRRVLESGPDDKVFIFHGGHGGEGFLLYPLDTTMTSKELNAAFKVMQEKKLYRELTFYLLACHSASMFDNGKLTDHQNIYAITAATRDGNATGKDCDLYHNIKGEEIEVCVNTEFGIGWLQDTETHDTESETLDEQFKYLHGIMKESEPVQFGDLKIAKEKLGNFEGHSNETKPQIPTSNSRETYQLPISKYSAYLILKRKIQRANSFEEKKNLMEELEKMEAEQQKLKNIIGQITSTIMKMPKNKMTNDLTEIQDCKHFVIKHVEKKCKFVLKSPFVDEFVSPLNRLCEYDANAKEIMKQLDIHCEKF